MQSIVSLFQGVPGKSENEVRPQYLVNTTQVLGVGYTLTAATRLVQYDPEWLERDEMQARKRINRITQHVPTHTYSLRAKGSVIEELIHQRQDRRAAMIAASLNADLIDRNSLAQRPEGEEDPNESAVATEDVMEVL